MKQPVIYLFIYFFAVALCRKSEFSTLFIHMYTEKHPHPDRWG